MISSDKRMKNTLFLFILNQTKYSNKSISPQSKLNITIHFDILPYFQLKKNKIIKNWYLLKTTYEPCLFSGWCFLKPIPYIYIPNMQNALWKITKLYPEFQNIYFECILHNTTYKIIIYN